MEQAIKAFIWNRAGKTPVTAFMAFLLSFWTGAVGQPRAGDSSLLLVREEPDKQGQMRRFSYKVFTEPKPRFLNCDMMLYLVWTVSSRFQPIQPFRTKFILPASPSSGLCSHTDTWERLSFPLDTLISRQQSLTCSFLKTILWFVLYRKYLPGEYWATCILNSGAAVCASLFSVLRRFSSKSILTLEIVFFLSSFSLPMNCSYRLQMLCSEVTEWCWTPVGLLQILCCNPGRCLSKIIYFNLQTFAMTFIEIMNLSPNHLFQFCKC